MGSFRWLRIMARWLLSALQLAPVFALVAAILVDEGPTGEARASSHYFPLVLWLFDDFAWTCARNSVIFALVVSISSLALGVGLRCALDRVWPRGRPLLGAAALAVVAVSPAFLALGLKGVFLDRASWPVRAEWSGAESAGASLESWSGVLLWLTWIYSAVPPAAAFVATACASSFRRLDPTWADAARLAGASSYRIARDLFWPIVRPAAVRAAGAVFLIAMVEPGAPLVLGLRRTLAFQIVDAATGPDAFPRAAVWALMAGLLGLCGWLVFRSLGRAPIAADPSSAACALRLDRREHRAAAVVAIISAVWLSLWAIVVWLPVAGLFGFFTRSGGSSPPADGGLAGAVLTAAAPLRDPVFLQVLLDSAVFALEVACGLLLVAWVAGLECRSRSPLGSRRWLGPLTAFPPLVLGTGVLAMPWLAALGSRFLLDRGGDRAAVLAGDLAAAIDPHQHLWILMACGVGLVILPRIFRYEGVSPAGSSGRQSTGSGYAAAVHAGAPRWRAAALGKPGILWRLAGRFAIVWVVAATNLTPALLFSAQDEGQTLGPAFLALAGGDAAARSQAAALALLSVLANLAAFALACGMGAVPCRASERDL
jgi:ABC-type Fe3+ transport system permease subunit